VYKAETTSARVKVTTCSLSPLLKSISESNLLRPGGVAGFLEELATDLTLGPLGAGVVFCHRISPANNFLGAVASLNLEHQSPLVC
jgi:hypothetical protein